MKLITLLCVSCYICMPLYSMSPDKKDEAYDAIIGMLQKAEVRQKKKLQPKRHNACLEMEEEQPQNDITVINEYMKRCYVARKERSKYRQIDFPCSRLVEAINEGESVEKIKILLEQGAFVNEIDSNGRTALHWAMLSDNVIALSKLLLACGADATIKDHDGRTPIDLMPAKYKVKNSSQDLLDAALTFVQGFGNKKSD